MDPTDVLEWTDAIGTPAVLVIILAIIAVPMLRRERGNQDVDDIRTIARHNVEIEALKRRVDALERKVNK